jgi:outer membrane protein TolC
VAVAGLYPYFSIPLTYGPTTSTIGETFRHASLLWRVGLDGTQSLYAGGRLSAQVDAARAGKNAALLSYRQTVLNAFAEVEDALSSQAAEQARYEPIDGQVAADARAVDEAQQRYRNGRSASCRCWTPKGNFMQRRTLRSAAP